MMYGTVLQLKLSDKQARATVGEIFCSLLQEVAKAFRILEVNMKT